jgi:steroid 5-alpha reductase family enzyme
MIDIGVIVASAVLLMAYMSALYLIALLTKDNGIADIGYGGGFIVFSGAVWNYGTPGFVGTFLFVLVVLWGVRLIARISRKNFGKPEDFRYAKWRAEWKWFRLRSFFQVFMLQGCIIAVIATPVVLSQFAGNRSEFVPLIVLGSALWLLGFLFESIGDRQLDRFLKDPANRGRIMTTGLWKYSRHPNYFGEASMWWGIWLISLSVIPELWYLTIASPLLITFLLTKVSGIPMLEKRWEGNPEWEAYRARTNALIPWFPRRP